MLQSRSEITPLGGSYAADRLRLQKLHLHEGKPRIAGIFSPRLFRDLAPIAQCFPLTRENWRRVLACGDIDLVLIEPVTESMCGDWTFLVRLPAMIGEVEKLVTAARELAIAVVYWESRDVADVVDSLGVAQLCHNRVFFDPSISWLFDSLGQGNSVCGLLPVQPFYCREIAAPVRRPLAVLDGLGHIFRHPKDYDYLATRDARCLDIIDSEFLVLPDKTVHLSLGLRANLAGYVCPELMPMVLQRYSVLLVAKDSLNQPLTRCQKILEALASGLSVVSLWQPPAWFQESVLIHAGEAFLQVETPRQALQAIHDCSRLRRQPLSLADRHDIQLLVSRLLQMYAQGQS